MDNIKISKKYIPLLKVLSAVKEELMVSGSDDFTLFLWQPTKDKKSLSRMTGKNKWMSGISESQVLLAIKIVVRLIVVN